MFEKSLTLSKNPISIYGVLLLVLVYRVLLDFSYLFYIHPYFLYNGFSLEISMFKTLLSYSLVIVFSTIMPRRKDVGCYAIQFFFLFVYLPMSSYFNFGGGGWLWFGLFQLFWIFLIAAMHINFRFEQAFTITPKLFRWIYGTLGLFVLITIFQLIQKVDIKFSFDLYAVYEIRATNPQGKISFGAYTVNWIAKVILPFFILWFFSRKNFAIKSIAILPIIAVVLLFFMTGHKAFLFNIPFVILCFVLIYSNRFFELLLITLIGVITTSFVLWLFFDKELAMSLFVRRTLFIPAQLSYYYHDFFQGEPLLMSNSIMQSIISYPYAAPPPYLIADYYLGKPEMSANNGVITDGFKQFGVVGILIWSIFFGVILKFLSDISKYKNHLIFGPLVLLGIKTWIDGALLTGILTHGFGITILLLILYPSFKNKAYRTKNIFSVFKIGIKKGT